MWQDVAAIGIVLLAVGYLAVVVLRRRKGGKTTGCGGGCSSCPTQDETPSEIVSISNVASSTENTPTDRQQMS